GNGGSPDVVIAVEEPSGGHDVDRSTEQLRQGVLESDQVKQRAMRFELNEEVDVAGAKVVAAGHRPEH
ncbi:hypothetical protein IFR05_017646, partial [Cadophora sp. M221]